MKICRNPFRGGFRYYFYCPACKSAHNYIVGAGIPKQDWTFTPPATFYPSLREYYTKWKTKEEVTTCHLFVKEGKIEYCTDCPHDHAGKIIDLPDFPKDYGMPDDIETVL